MKKAKTSFGTKRQPRGTKTGKFDSGFEAQVSKSMPRKKGVKVVYEGDTIKYSRTRLYLPDFSIYYPDGRITFIECKGWFRPEDKMKMEFVLFCNPTLDIRMVFPRKNKRDVAWCEKMNVKYAFASVPKEWINE